MMWLRAARNRTPVRAVAALLAVFVCGSALEGAHPGGDDRDCGGAPSAHDHTAHRLAADRPLPPSSTDHCYLCHSLRLLGTALAVTNARPGTDSSSTRFTSVDACTVGQFVRLDVPSRAPPAVLL